MARPRKRIDYELVEKLGKIHCTQDEIAQVLGVSVDTMQRHKRFNDLYAHTLADGRMSLRRLQWESAEGCEGVPLRDDDGNIMFTPKGAVVWLREPRKPSTTMQVWLGKQNLGQRDQVGITDGEGGPVKINVIEVRLPSGNPS